MAIFSCVESAETSYRHVAASAAAVPLCSPSALTTAAPHGKVNAGVGTATSHTYARGPSQQGTSFQKPVVHISAHCSLLGSSGWPGAQCVYVIGSTPCQVHCAPWPATLAPIVARSRPYFSTTPSAKLTCWSESKLASSPPCCTHSARACSTLSADVYGGTVYSSVYDGGGGSGDGDGGGGAGGGGLGEGDGGGCASASMALACASRTPCSARCAASSASCLAPSALSRASASALRLAAAASADCSAVAATAALAASALLLAASAAASRAVASSAACAASADAALTSSSCCRSAAALARLLQPETSDDGCATRSSSPPPPTPLADGPTESCTAATTPPIMTAPHMSAVHMQHATWQAVGRKKLASGRSSSYGSGSSTSSRTNRPRETCFSRRVSRPPMFVDAFAQTKQSVEISILTNKFLSW